MSSGVTHDPMLASLARLLEECLGQWQRRGAVEITADPVGIALSTQDAELSIARAPDGMPFRWVIVANGRRRVAASVNGVLRIVRQTLAPGYQPLGLRVAPQPSAIPPGQAQP